MVDQKLFLSYSRSDSEIVLELTTQLKNAGANVWLDQLDIPFGAIWDVEIEKALEACECILFVVSQLSVASNNVLNEVYYGLEEGKKVLPIIINDCKIPFRIRRLQHIDLSVNYEKGFNQLLKTLNLENKRELIEQKRIISEKDFFNTEEEIAWNKVEQENTISAYKDYLRTYTNGKYKSGAMNNIGRMYSEGIVVAKDFKKAMEWYLKAADVGNAYAMNSIGILYAVGNGVVKDYRKAMEWFLKAAEGGYAEAMKNIGDTFTEGKGVAKNYNKAMEWYIKAAEAGDAAAMSNIGYMYNEGIGVTKDYNKAMEWFLKAADVGSNAYAMNGIGFLYAVGNGVAKDYNKAMEWFLKAAEGGYADAMTNIGLIYEKGDGVTKDYSKAMEWFLKAAEAGDPAAMKNIGDLYKTGKGVAQDFTKVKEWYEKAENTLKF